MVGNLSRASPPDQLCSDKPTTKRAHRRTLRCTAWRCSVSTRRCTPRGAPDPARAHPWWDRSQSRPRSSSRPPPTSAQAPPAQKRLRPSAWLCPNDNGQSTRGVRCIPQPVGGHSGWGEDRRRGGKTWCRPTHAPAANRQLGSSSERERGLERGGRCGRCGAAAAVDPVQIAFYKTLIRTFYAKHTLHGRMRLAGPLRGTCNNKVNTDSSTKRVFTTALQ